MLDSQTWGARNKTWLGRSTARTLGAGQGPNPCAYCLAVLEQTRLVPRPMPYSRSGVSSSPRDPSTSPSTHRRSRPGEGFTDQMLQAPARSRHSNVGRFRLPSALGCLSVDRGEADRHVSWSACSVRGARCWPTRPRRATPQLRGQAPARRQAQPPGLRSVTPGGGGPTAPDNASGQSGVKDSLLRKARAEIIEAIRRILAAPSPTTVGE